jgi:phytanoyl-CoA hydroxylase
MTQEQVAELNENGFLVVRGLLDPVRDLRPVIDEYTHVLNERAREWKEAGEITSALPGPGFQEHVLLLCSQPTFRRQHLAELDITLPHFPFSYIRETDQMHAGPAMFALLRSPRILDFMEGLLGPQIRASPNQHCRIKLPERLLETPGTFKAQRGETIYSATLWHQDMHTQMPQSDETEMVTVWMPLTSVRQEDGCLLVAPGAHKEGLLPWPIPEETRAALNRRSVPLTAEPGDAVLLHKKTPHASLPNRSNSVRWSLDFRYFPAHQPTDRPWFPDFLVRSRPQPEKELRDPARWAELWRQARTRMARSGEPVPGRREFALLVANALIDRWARESHAGDA